MKKLIIGLVLLVVVVGVAVNWMLSATPALKLNPEVKAVGMETPVRVEVSSPHGIRRVTAWIEQDGKRHQVHQQTESARRLSLFRSTEAPRTVEFTAGKKQ